MALLTLNPGYQSSVTLKVLDAYGEAASLDGVPVWSASDSTIASLEVADDGLSGLISYVGKGSATITVTGDADLGDGIKELIGTLSVVCAAPEAITIELVASEPVMVDDESTAETASTAA